MTLLSLIFSCFFSFIFVFIFFIPFLIHFPPYFSLFYLFFVFFISNSLFLFSSSVNFPRMDLLYCSTEWSHSRIHGQKNRMRFLKWL